MGHRHSEVTKQKISEKRREQFLREVKERDPALEPTVKRCPGPCGETKPVEEFGTRKQPTKAGLVSVTPRTLCRPCESARTQRWKEARIAEGTWEEYRIRKEAKRDPAKRRQYMREYSAMRRRKEGAKQMNTRRPKESRATMDYPIEPISVLVEVLEAQGLTQAEISNRSGVEPRRLYAIKHGTAPSTSIDNIDRLLMAFERQDDLEDMYPLEEPEKLVGYGVLDPEGILNGRPS